MKWLHIKMAHVAKGIKRWKKEENRRHKTAACHSEKSLVTIISSSRA
jgi:hypothetical protein